MRKLVLVGNPNTGKTTLFNTLTSSREHAGNWHGVTVAVKEKKAKIMGEEFLVCDLPGLYSLEAFSEEEKVASDFVLNNPDAIFVCIADANNLRRNLYLALELEQRCRRVILAVNMAKEVKSFNAEALERELGFSVCGIDARTRRGVKKLKEGIVGSEIHDPGEKIRAENRTFSIEEFEKRAKIGFDKIDDILARSGYKVNGFYGSSKIDKILLSEPWSFIIFALVMAAVFFITFGRFGSFLSGLVNSAFESLSSRLVTILTGSIKKPAIIDFIDQGIFGGALTILSFLPQIVLLFTCLNFLEDIGYLSRVAYSFDRLFKKFGLTGRSAFSLIMGFGCTTTAVMTTRNLDSKRLKKRTAIMLPFMSCSAKLPIYAVFCAAFFPKYKALIVFGLYMLGILLFMLVASLIKKYDRAEEKDNFMLEFPKYRLPSIRKVLSNALSSACEFFVRVGGVLLLCSMIVFLLYNFSFSEGYVAGDYTKSILYSIAKVISPIFIPLGFGTANAVIAILAGVMAKEMVVSSLAIINGVSALGLASSLAAVSSPVHFTTLSAISFLVFVLLYTPCVSAVISMKREIGRKGAALSVLLQVGIAYITSALVYGLGKMFLSGLWWVAVIVLIVLACLVLIMLKYKPKRAPLTLEAVKLRCVGCKENCNGNNCPQGRGY